jgi:hypothetical protein
VGRGGAGVGYPYNAMVFRKLPLVWWFLLRNSLSVI